MLAGLDYPIDGVENLLAVRDMRNITELERWSFFHRRDTHR
jgi:hypothetical protein